MIRGLYTSTSAMLLESTRQDIVSNNIANVDTPGFKLDRLAVKTEPEYNIHRIDDHKMERVRLGIEPSPFVGKMGTGVAVKQRYTDHSQGNLVPTNNEFDLALQGEGFFLIDTPQGVRLTRAGTFHSNNDGDLVDGNNNKVLSVSANVNLNANLPLITENGDLGITASTIKLNEEEKFGVGKDGLVFEGTEPTDRIITVKFDNPEYLHKTGDNYYAYSDKRAGIGRYAADTTIQQGNIEKSNVKSIDEMVKMIMLYRSFEMNQKLIQTQDEELGRAVNNIARLG